MNGSDSNSIGERYARLERKITLWERVKMAARVLVSAQIARDATQRMGRQARPIRPPRILWSGV
ncbi:MAG: hypothetical protein ACLQU2_33505 [Candidatus Binataceae bacterium]